MKFKIKFRKLFVIFLSTLIFTQTTLLMPKPTQASVAFMTGGNAPLALVGLITCGIGLVPEVMIAISGISDPHAPPIGWMILSTLGLPLVFIGGFILEPQTTQARLQFSSLTPTQALELGMTDLEYQAFQNDIEQVNALTESTFRDLQLQPELDLQNVQNIWKQTLSQMPELTQIALSKILFNIQKN